MSFRPQQVWSQWTIRASMPLGEPSLSMQGSLTPLFLSAVLTLSLPLLLYSGVSFCLECIQYSIKPPFLYL